MKMKSILLTVALAANLAAPAFANEGPVSAPFQLFSEADTQMLFAQDAKPMQLASLSQTEMKETEGALWWYVPYAVYYYAPAATSLAFTVYNSSAYLPVYHYSNFIYNTWKSW